MAYNIKPIEVSHAYSINSTAFVVEATYHPDESFSKSYIIVKKAADDPIPSNHKELLPLVTSDPGDGYDAEFNPITDTQFALMRTKNSDYKSGQHTSNKETWTKHEDDTIGPNEL